MFKNCGLLILLVPAVALAAAPAGHDLPEIQASGVLRHLALPYANFVTGSGDGFDVELAQGFAAEIGVRYEMVVTDWNTTLSDLTGVAYERNGADVRIVGEAPVRGDMIGHGLTYLEWRDQLVDYSAPLFPTQIWLITPAGHELNPIRPTGDLTRDIAAVEACLSKLQVLAKPGTCLDPKLYALEAKCARVELFEESLNYMAPAVLEGIAEATILDVPDALVALRHFPGRLKVIGPLSPVQFMACAFAPDQPQLRAAFARYQERIVADGTYLRLIRKYYPAVLDYFPDFFRGAQVQP